MKAKKSTWANGRTYFFVFLVVCCGLLGKISLAEGYSNSAESSSRSKAHFLATKVSQNHDFTKVSPDVSYRPNHLIVRFAPNSEGNQRLTMEHQNTLDALGGGTLKQNLMASRGIFLIELPEGQTIEEALKIYNARDDIFYAEPDYEVELLTTIPNDPSFGDLWGMHNTGQSGGDVDADIDAPEAWDIRTNAQDIIVAVIDTGVDYTHEDLAANIWVNEVEQNGSADYDDDGNGYIDDIYGYDFAYYDSNPMDGHYHGTHCAGTIGAVGNNGTGVAGVCWNVKIMAVKFLDDGGSGWTADAIKSVEYAMMMGAHIMSNSWGGRYYDQGLKDAIDGAGEAGILFVAAAGNSGLNDDIYPHYPSSYTSQNIISVMATDPNDARAIWPEYPASSCYGATSVDIAAPGSDILSCAPGDNYQYLDGTSMATPHVAGACALVWSKCPGLTYSEVKQIILDTADGLDSLSGLCVTEGRLNIYQALLALPFELSIVDDVADPYGSVEPGGTVTFTITYANGGGIGAAYDTLIEFTLPAALEYDNIYDPNYDPISRTYTWDIGTLEEEQGGQLEITVTVTTAAEPAGAIESIVTMTASNFENFSRAAEYTPVGCWTDAGAVIYVDAAANGFNTGVDWQNAYTDLADALARAAKGCGGDIWVAGGNYEPGPIASSSFVLPDGVSVYGGFRNGGCDFSQRNPALYKTILTGQVGEQTRADIVVTMGDETLLDGFTVTKAADYGIFGDGVDFTIENCSIKDSDNYGIRAIDGNITIRWCQVSNNKYHGILHQGGGFALTIENSWLMRSGRYGIFCIDSTPTVKNSIVSESSFIEPGYAGIVSINPTEPPILYNNTIANNRAEGILFTDNHNSEGDPNYLDLPDVQNCILYYNNAGGAQITGFDPDDTAYYCCIADCNDVNFNISDEPVFAYAVDPNGTPDPNNYHLAYNSVCKDAGSLLLTYTGQTDVDSEERVVGEAADIGADELYSCDGDYTEDDFYNALDWNADGAVNMTEFNFFSKAWFSHDPNDPVWLGDPNLADPNAIINWNPACNLYPYSSSAYEIDVLDLVEFVDNVPWLWEACWRENYIAAYSMFSGDGESFFLGESEPLTETMSIELTAEPAEADYADMPTSTLISLVEGIQGVIEYIELTAAENPEEAENLLDIKDFLEEVLADIEASRQ